MIHILLLALSIAFTGCDPAPVYPKNRYRVKDMQVSWVNVASIDTAGCLHLSSCLDPAACDSLGLRILLVREYYADSTSTPNLIGYAGEGGDGCADSIISMRLVAKYQDSIADLSGKIDQSNRPIPYLEPTQSGKAYPMAKNGVCFEMPAYENLNAFRLAFNSQGKQFRMGEEMPISTIFWVPRSMKESMLAARANVLELRMSNGVWISKEF